jgi:hypothetical protein
MSRLHEKFINPLRADLASNTWLEPISPASHPHYLWRTARNKNDEPMKCKLSCRIPGGKGMRVAECSSSNAEL